MSSSSGSSFSSSDSLPLSMKIARPVARPPAPGKIPKPIILILAQVYSFFQFLSSYYFHLVSVGISWRRRVEGIFHSFSRWIVRGWLAAIVAGTFLFTLMISAGFLYLLFYAWFMPSFLYNFPVRFDFSPLAPQPPIALVKLQERQWENQIMSLSTEGNNRNTVLSSPLLYPGQSYHVYLDLEIPDSPQNAQLGMITLEAILRHSPSNSSLAETRISFTTKYSSFFIRIAYQCFLLFPFLSGILQESQFLSIPLFEFYQEPMKKARIIENSGPMATGASGGSSNAPGSSSPSISSSGPLYTDSCQLRFLTENARHFEYYSISLRFQTQLRGLRYYMYHYFYTASLLMMMMIFTGELIGGFLLALGIYWKFGKSWQTRKGEAGGVVSEEEAKERVWEKMKEFSQSGEEETKNSSENSESSWNSEGRKSPSSSNLPSSAIPTHSSSDSLSLSSMDAHDSDSDDSEAAAADAELAAFQKAAELRRRQK